MSAKPQDLKPDREAASDPALNRQENKLAPRRRGFAKAVMTLGLVSLIGAAAYGYWAYTIRFPSTDDAYIEAKVLQIAPFATGVISEVDVKEFSHVDAGDVLLKVDHIAIKASVNGIVGKVNLSSGEIARAGISLFPLVDTTKWWVEANFKESDLARIAPGQPASVVVDLYPDHEFKGTVEAISPTSVASSSLLPPDNSSGNWVKVSQRFTVRISLTPQPGDPELRVGASATVTVDTTKGLARGAK